MDNGGLVTIIIPVYNAAPYINEALQSVLHQTYENLEIILIDDGSTDGSGKICDNYADHDLRFKVIHQENKGLSAARNIGLDMMSGFAVAFLDSDDAYQPGYVEQMVTAMIEENVDLVLCKYRTYRTTGNMVGNGSERVRPLIEKGTYNQVVALQALVDGNLNHSAWNKLYSRNLWQNIRFPVGQVYEDIATTYRILANCNRVCVIDQSLYCYRKRPGSILETYSQDNLNDWLLSNSSLESFVEENISNIFSNRHLTRLRQRRINGMVSYFVRIYGNDNSSCEELRQRIKAEGKKCGLGECSVRRKVFYRIICSCPRLLYIIRPIYKLLRSIYRTVLKPRLS
jgi:glycosyltransferase involved in cell wall biosynthesis